MIFYISEYFDVLIGRSLGHGQRATKMVAGVQVQLLLQMWQYQ